MTDRRVECSESGLKRSIRATAPGLDQAFEDAVRTLVGVVADPQSVKSCGAVHIVCSAADLRGLLRAWIDAVCDEMARRGVVFGDFQVHLRNGTLAAVALGEAASDQQMSSIRALAAATVSDVSVHKDVDQWVVACQVVFRAGNAPSGTNTTEATAVRRT